MTFIDIILTFIIYIVYLEFVPYVFSVDYIKLSTYKKDEIHLVSIALAIVTYSSILILFF